MEYYETEEGYTNEEYYGEADEGDENTEYIPPPPAAPAPKWAAAPTRKKAGEIVKSLLLKKASAPIPPRIAPAQPHPKIVPPRDTIPPPAKRLKVAKPSLQERSQQQVVVSLTNLPQGYDQKRLMGLLEYCGLEPSCLIEAEISDPSFESEEETLIARLTFDCMPNALAACRELNGQEVSTMYGGAETLAAEVEEGQIEEEVEESRSKGWKEAVLASLAPARKREVPIREPPRTEQGAQVFVRKRKLAEPVTDEMDEREEKVLLDYIAGKSEDDVKEEPEYSRRNSRYGRRREDENSCTVKLSSLPEGYDEKKLVGLLEFLEIDTDGLESIRFLKPFADQEVLTLSAILEFDCHESAALASDELNGQEVIARDGDVRRLVAQLTQQTRDVQRYQAEPSGKKGGGKNGKGDKKGGNHQSGPQQIYPSVYFSDVPKEFNNESMRQLHVEADLDTDSIMGMKFLPSRDGYGETCCCIIRYIDDAAAQEAIESLQNSKVLTSSGDRKFLGAKMAQPAKWMHQHKRW